VRHIAITEKNGSSTAGLLAPGETRKQRLVKAMVGSKDREGGSKGGGEISSRVADHWPRLLGEKPVASMQKTPAG